MGYWDCPEHLHKHRKSSIYHQIEVYWPRADLDADVIITSNQYLIYTLRKKEIPRKLMDKILKMKRVIKKK